MSSTTLVDAIDESLFSARQFHIVPRVRTRSGTGVA